MKKEILTIQYLRAIAALLVVYVHTFEQAPWLKDIFDSSFGYAGVDLFFVISGFIMVYSTHNKTITSVQFFWHRILRVVPLYWFFTISLIVIAYVMPSAVKSVELVPLHIFDSFFFIPSLSPVDPDKFWPVLIPGWTLNYEMAFYALFAFSLILKDILRLWFLIVVMIGFVIIGFQSSSNSIIGFYSNMIILEFLVGVVLGYLFVTDKLQKNTLLGFFIVTLGIVYYFTIQNITDTNRFFSAGIAATLIVLGALLIDHSKQKEISWLHLLGNASYSIYLSHVFTLGLYRFVLKHIDVSYSENITNGILLVVIAIIFSAFVGIAVYKLIEMPMNEKLRKKPH